MLGKIVLEKLYPDFKDDIEANGIDLRVGKIYNFEDSNEVGLYNDIKKLPPINELAKSKKVLPDKNIGYGYYLRPGISYSVTVDRIMKIPKGFSQLYFPRSSLIRSNISLFTAVGDSGFEGTLQFKIRNDGDVDFFLGENERFCQMVSFRVEGAGYYDGDYQEKK